MNLLEATKATTIATETEIKKISNAPSKIKVSLTFKTT